MFSFKQIVKGFSAAGVKRAIIVERASNPFEGIIEVHVHPKHEKVVHAWLLEHKPMMVSYTLKKLPWWRCWFKRYQLKWN